MKVNVESLSGFDVLRYSGTHACVATETAETAVAGHRGIRFFVEEDEARVFLLAVETSQGEPSP